MATLVQRGKKRIWYAVLEEGTDANGKRRQRWISLRTSSKREARDALAQFEAKRLQGTLSPAHRETLTDFLRRWLEEVATLSLRPTTLESYRTKIERHLIPALGHHRLTDLRPEHLQAYYAQALQSARKDGRQGTLSPRTVQYCHAVLHRALKHAVRCDLIVRNPADAVTPPRPERTRGKTWSADEATKFLATAHADDLHALYVLAITTGMREGELLGLRWEDVDLTGQAVHVRQSLAYVRGQGLVFTPTKTHRSQRAIELSAPAVDALRRHRKAQAERRLILGPDWHDIGIVFPGPFGRPMHPAHFYRWHFQRLVKRAGVPSIRFHDLRHTCATLLLASGVNPKVVQERLGHATISVTMDTYSHVLPGLQRAAAEALDQVLHISGSEG